MRCAQTLGPDEHVIDRKGRMQPDAEKQHAPGLKRDSATGRTKDGPLHHDEQPDSAIDDVIERHPCGNTRMSPRGPEHRAPGTQQIHGQILCNGDSHHDVETKLQSTNDVPGQQRGMDNRVSMIDFERKRGEGLSIGQRTQRSAMPTDIRSSSATVRRNTRH